MIDNNHDRVNPHSDTPLTPNQRREAALEYAILFGWHVLPLHYPVGGKCSCEDANCKRQGKHPLGKLVPRGLKDATTEEATIRRWWAEYPLANVGIRTGKEAGVFVVGPDGVRGLADLKEVEKEYGELPKTLRSWSGGGGEHWFFRYPEGGKIRNRRDHRGLKIDVRGDGGYVVAPPSLHVSGKEYKWLDSPWEGEVAEACPGLVEWCQAGQEGAGGPGVGDPCAPPQPGPPGRPDRYTRAALYLEACDPAISGDGGHDQAFYVVRAVVYGFNLGPKLGFELLREKWNPECQPNWSEQELWHKCQEADTVPFHKPRGWLLNEERERPEKARSSKSSQANRQGERCQEQHPPTGEVSPNGQEGEGLRTICLADLKPRAVDWLVPAYLPVGKLVVIAGKGGLGKSLITLDMVACLTTGRAALGLEYEPPSPVDVLLISCEDDWEDTILPRLLAAGADPKRAHGVEGIAGRDGKVLPFNLDYWPELERKLAAHPGIKLVVIDPVVAYVGQARVNDHQDSQVRGLLTPLAELAKKHRVTVLLVMHLNKREAGAVQDRVSGSVGYVNAGRAAFLVAPVANNGDRGLLPFKWNLGEEPPGIAYRVEPLEPDDCRHFLDQHASDLSDDAREELGKQLIRIKWMGPVEMDAEQALAGTVRQGRDQNPVDSCADWLAQFLAQYAYPAKELEAAAKEAGFSLGTLARAKSRLKTAKGLRTKRGNEYQAPYWIGLGHPETWTPRPDPGGNPTG